MHSFLKNSMGALLVVILGLACPGVGWARGGGGGGGGHGGGGFGGGGHGGGFGGGGFHGGGFGGYHGGSMGGFHGYGGTSHGSFSTPHYNGGSGFAAHNLGGVNRSGTFARSGNFGLGGVNHFNPAVNPGHFTAGVNNHPVNPMAWNHEGNWNHFGQFNHPGQFNRFGEYGRYGRFHDFDDFLFSPFLFAGGWGFGYPGWWWPIGSYYGWNDYPYYGSYYGDYYPATTYASTVAYPSSDYILSGDQTLPNTEQAQPSETDWGAQYLSAAREAFKQGDYGDALRLASHAAIELPKSAKPHELMSLAAFALKDYRGANMEAHASLALGPAADWATLYGYYGDLPTYTKQLDALVDYLHEHKDAEDARFVLAYHDLMMGHDDAAKAQFEKVLVKIPQDRLAADELKKLGGNPPPVTTMPATVPAIAVPPSSTEATTPISPERKAPTPAEQEIH